MVQVVIREILGFFDGGRDLRRHSAAMNQLFGEELGLALLKRHLLASGYDQVIALDDPCTQGTSKGVRLDRWLRVTNRNEVTLFQVEVKNWCAHSLKGKPLALDADEDVIAQHAAEMWRRYWNEETRQPNDEELQKVLVPMRRPQRYATDIVQPIACIWDALHPHSDVTPITPWFEVPTQGSFQQLRWFSMSIYLRGLLKSGVLELELELPKVEARMSYLTRMIRHAPPNTAGESENSAIPKSSR